jgi:hypothetical protein
MRRGIRVACPRRHQSHGGVQRLRRVVAHAVPSPFIIDRWAFRHADSSRRFLGRLVARCLRQCVQGVSDLTAFVSRRQFGNTRCRAGAGWQLTRRRSIVGLSGRLPSPVSNNRTSDGKKSDQRYARECLGNRRLYGVVSMLRVRRSLRLRRSRKVPYLMAGRQLMSNGPFT